MGFYSLFPSRKAKKTREGGVRKEEEKEKKRVENKKGEKEGRE